MREPTLAAAPASPRIALLGCILWLSACGGGGTHEAALQPTQQVELPSGPRLAIVPRPVEALHLAIWIDAGSRDADPPQLAAVTAWTAAASLGDDVRVRVLPDGTMLGVRCAKARMAACLKRLAGALGQRRPADAAVRRAIQHLSQARRRARTDSAEHADRLALEALLGEQAAGFVPLGEPETDAQLSTQRVAAFLSDHYGPGRALVTAVGDVSARELAAAVEAGFVGLPRARATRRAHTLELSGGVEVAIGDESVVTLAMAAPDLEHAAGLATRLAGPLWLNDTHAAEARAHAFPVRGGALTLVRVAHADPEAVSRRLAHHAAMILEEGVSAEPPAPSAEGLRAAAQWEAMQWLTRGPAKAPSAELALGAVAPDSNARAASDPHASRARLQRTVTKAFQRGLHDAKPQMDGDIDAGRVSATLANGARLEARRLASSRRVAVAVEIAGGAAYEPADAHGRTALLATLAATSCRGLSYDALQTRLHELNAHFEPVVGTDTWGLQLEAAAEHWGEALALAAHCLGEPSFRPEAIRQAKARLHARLQAHSPWAAQQAIRLVAPAAPGRVAPWGDASHLAALGRRELKRLHTQSVVGSRISIAVVGPAAADRMAMRLARRVSPLERGRLPAAPVPDRPAPGMLAGVTDGPRSRIVVGWRITNGPERPSRLEARAFAAVAGARVLELAEARPLWHGGNAGRWGAWSAFAVEVTDAALEDFDSRVRQAVSAMDDSELRRRVERLHARTKRRQRHARGNPSRWARLLAARRLGEAFDTTDHDGELSTARALRETTPRYLIAHPPAQAPVAASLFPPPNHFAQVGLDTAPSASYMGLRTAPRTERYTLPRHRPPVAFWPRLPDRVRRWRPPLAHEEAP